MRAQTFSSLLRAEIARLTGPGGARAWLIVAVGFAVLSSLATVLLSNVEDVQEFVGLTTAGLVSSAPMSLLMILALGVTSHKAREISDGTVLTSKALVPRTKLLFTARMAAWTALAVVLGAVVAIVALFMSIMPSALIRSSILQTLSTTIISLFLCALFVLFFAAGTALLQRAAVIVFAGMMVIVVLPIALTIIGSFVPGTLGAVVTKIGYGLPGQLLYTSLMPPVEGGDVTWAKWGGSVAGVVLWVALLSYLAYRQFCKPGYGDS